MGAERLVDSAVRPKPDNTKFRCTEIWPGYGQDVRASGSLGPCHRSVPGRPEAFAATACFFSHHHYQPACLAVGTGRGTADWLLRSVGILGDEM